jgi:molybdate/tungstate transport system substrate-binding protein
MKLTTINAFFLSFPLWVTLLFCPILSGVESAPRNKSLIIFHAGSLSVPIKKITTAFNKRYPDIKVILESAGSRECARKVTELHRECDIIASADYAVIDTLLIPEYASWSIKFASAQISIVFNEGSKYSNEINPSNWYKILQRPDVICGASDPNSDPCGYRTIFVVKLAQIYYGIPNLYRNIMKKKHGLLFRPKEVDLISLLESNNIDYVFLYKSVAIQHGLKHIDLPVQIDLSSQEYADYYSKVSVSICGNKPDSPTEQKGEPIFYGLTILKNATNKAEAIKYIQFMLTQNDGIKILKECGINSIVPASTSRYSNVPKELKQFVKY